MLTKEKLTYPLIIKIKKPETTDTYSFVLEIPKELKTKFHYKAGQFISLFLNIDGQEVRRSYSLSSSPDWDTEFKFSVKRVDGGLVSNHLINQVNEGDTLYVTPPAGLFCLPKESTDNIVFFAGGSGITPVISLIKSALKTSNNSKICMLYCSRDEDSVIFHRELRDILNQFPERFFYENNLTQPKKEFAGMTGRLVTSNIRDFLKKHNLPSEAHYFVCGPEGFMDTVLSALEIMEVDKSRIHQESFLSPTPKTSDYLETVGHDAVFIGDKSTAAMPETIEAEVDGDWIQVKAKEGMSVLETLLEAGQNPPYSCMDGACMACMGKVQEGLVYQNDLGILTSDNTEIGECLTCQAIPASKNLKISYEI